MDNIIISGNFNTSASVYSRINISKPNAIYPQLQAQNVGYTLGDCPLVAIEYDGFSPNKIINIIDSSDSIFENTDTYYTLEKLQYSTGHIFSHYKAPSGYYNYINYLVTDKVLDNLLSRPLFYQYELLYDARCQALENPIKNIYKNNELVIPKTSYSIEVSDDLLLNGSGRYSDTEWVAFVGNQTTNDIKRTRVLLPIDFADISDYYTIEYEKVVNGIISYQKELIELAPIYVQGTDYTIAPSGISFGSATNDIYCVKDPGYKIEPLGITVIKGQSGFTSYVSDVSSSWNLRLNIGSFFKPSGYYTGQSEAFYYLPNPDPGVTIPIVNTKPEILASNILKVSAKPIYIDTSASGFIYPNYNVPVYDNTLPDLMDNKGKIAIDINGVTRNDIKIISIDREKGILELSENVSSSDEIELSFYIESDSSVVLENLELNPKVVSDAEYNISGYASGLGLAMIPYDGTINSSYPYIYDINSNQSTRVAYSVPPVGETPVSVNWADHPMFEICQCNLNRLTKDLVKYTDNRRIGGGLDLEKTMAWFKTNFSNKTNEINWYTSNGYYDGNPLAANGAIVIHIPQAILLASKQKWIDYYFTVTDDQALSDKNGIKEFKYYLDQFIKRYISAGAEYILIPIDGAGQFLPIEILE